jgi:putative ABC transport system ATP-binding protein
MPDRACGVGGCEIIAVSEARFAWSGRNAFSMAIEKFSLLRGQTLLLVGPSGSGKSTFLSLLAGIVVASAGSVAVLNTDLRSLSSAGRDRFRAEHIGIIFQMFNLIPYLSVLENALLPLSFAPARRRRAREQSGSEADEARRLLSRLELDQAMIHQPAASLSVGQQQRVAAVRALIGRPEILIADEPTSSLDRDRQQAFLDLLTQEVELARTTLLMVSHDESLAPRFGQVLRLNGIARTAFGAP